MLPGPNSEAAAPRLGAAVPATGVALATMRRVMRYAIGVVYGQSLAAAQTNPVVVRVDRRGGLVRDQLEMDHLVALIVGDPELSG